jgi:asparagine synthase (glutamine-hydrolysing)
MSGLAAILDGAGGPATSTAIERMLDASSHRGPSGRAFWTTGEGLSLGYQSFDTAGDAERQPLVHAARGLAIVFDGRLDNREDLVHELGLADDAVSDARLALEACAAWGADAPSRLLGDFAWIAWDAAARRLLAARDHLGVRPLHYAVVDRTVLCATDVAQLLAHPSVSRAPDLATVADYLSLEVRNTSATLFRDVRRVPPGHVLVVEAGRTSLVEYWRPSPRAPIRLRDDREYADQCREILARAVGCRLRGPRPVAALLSGGVDSSSIVTVATRLLPERSAGLTPFSLVFPGRPDADERPFIEDVAAQCGLKPVFVEPARVSASTLRRHAAGSHDCPGFASDFGAMSLYEAIRDRGYDVVLTGVAGDYLFGGSTFQYADYLRELRFAAAVRQFAADRGTASSGWSPLGLIQAGLWPLLPVRVKHALRPLARAVAGVPRPVPWLRLRREPPLPMPDEPRGGSFATEEVTRELASGTHSLFLEAGERVLAGVPLEARHPFLDVRLVDFALSIPETQRRRGPIAKYVLRNALRGELPGSVGSRRTKADFGYVIVEALDSLGGAAFFSRLAIAEAGWVDGRALAAAFGAMRRRLAAGEARYGEDVPSLWIVAAVELWFEAVCAPPGVTPVRARAII